MIARVREVTAAAVAAGSMLYVTGSMSTKTGVAAEARDAARRREKGIGARDDLVAGPDAEGHHGEQQRVGARRHADGVGDAQVGGQVALHALDLGAHDEALAVAHPRHDVDDGVADGAVLRLQVEHRHLHGCRGLPGVCWLP